MRYKESDEPGFYIRGDFDERILYESKNYKPIFDGLGRGFKALDLGAHIGTFARLCSVFGCAYVTCYEPYYPSFELLEFNLSQLKGGKFEAFNLAIGPHGPTVLNMRENPATNTVRGSAKETVDIMQVEYKAVVGLTDYQLVKIDIEGAEYSIDIEATPESVRRLVIELHAGDIKELHTRILNMGFEPMDPDIDKYINSGRCVLGLYKR